MGRGKNNSLVSQKYKRFTTKFQQYLSRQGSHNKCHPSKQSDKVHVEEWHRAMILLFYCSARAQVAYASLLEQCDSPIFLSWHAMALSGYTIKNKPLTPCLSRTRLVLEHNHACSGLNPTLTTNLVCTKILKVVQFTNQLYHTWFATIKCQNTSALPTMF